MLGFFIPSLIKVEVSVYKNIFTSINQPDAAVCSVPARTRQLPAYFETRVEDTSDMTAPQRHQCEDCIPHIFIISFFNISAALFELNCHHCPHSFSVFLWVMFK